MMDRRLVPHVQRISTLESKVDFFVQTKVPPQKWAPKSSPDFSPQSARRQQNAANMWREEKDAEGRVMARVKCEVVSGDNFASMFSAFDKFVTSCKAA